MRRASNQDPFTFGRHPSQGFHIGNVSGKVHGDESVNAVGIDQIHRFGVHQGRCWIDIDEFDAGAQIVGRIRRGREFDAGRAAATSRLNTCGRVGTVQRRRAAANGQSEPSAHGIGKTGVETLAQRPLRQHRCLQGRHHGIPIIRRDLLAGVGDLSHRRMPTKDLTA
jgi:hypothetical protein